MWSRHAQVRVHEVDLAAGRRRRRARRLPAARPSPSPTGGGWSRRRDGDGFVVVDLIRGRRPPPLHASPGRSLPTWRPRWTALGHVVSRAGVALLQVATAATVPLEHAHVVGDEDSIWDGGPTRLECREPAYLLSSSAQGAVPLVMATVVRADRLPPGRPPVRAICASSCVADEALVSWQRSGST